ncbi:MAG: hypothetical protein ABSB40_13830, partial [Nitrososphaeria archaeon]
HDDNGNTKSIQKYGPSGATTKFDYYGNGNLQCRTDANLHQTFYNWSNGKVSLFTNPIYSVSRVIKTDGTIDSETNGRKKTTSYTYDANLRLTGIYPPGVNPTTFTYLPNNRTVKQTRGIYTKTYTYDGYHRLVGTSDITGVTESTLYKANDLKNYSTSNIGDTIYYDDFGRKSRISHKDTHVVSFIYSASKVKVTDERCNNTTYTYNAFGNPDERFLVGVTDPLYATSYTYNILGKLLTITQGGVTRHYTYNPTTNYLTNETHPDRGTFTYQRDNVGNMTYMTDSGGQTHFVYDALNRLKSMTRGTNSVDFDYDNADNRTTLTNIDSTGTISSTIYYYDSFNRLTDKIQTIQGISDPFQTTYYYDRNDNVTEIFYPSGRHINYTYDPKNLVQVTSVYDDDNLWKIDTIKYYPSGTDTGLVRSFDNLNGVTTSLTYTPRNMVKSIVSSPSVLNLAYDYDAAGNLATFTDNLNPASFTDSSTSNTYNYDNTTYRLASVTGTAAAGFTYNYAGDVSTKTANGSTYTHQYDLFRNLTGISQSPGGNLATFSYDGDGKRISKLAGGVRTIYHYDKEGRLLSESDANGNAICDYIYLGTNLVGKMYEP